ncbi:hypothetical protein GUJ93_ZPchr0005g15253 [Zizania palustris]|uniref:Uncharacterized protein n=1 Tax=Zizania palustris TaxID=103762 RepID=A0A8J5SLS6_ZIZPA|nr:hypothetical protein GUJ93_ZPchr0005g15253 [Zizania palustris]
MEHGFYYPYRSSGGGGGGGSFSFSKKEKRPPLKRGQLKRQIARTLSNLVMPRSDAVTKSKPDDGCSSRREASYN